MSEPAPFTFDRLTASFARAADERSFREWTAGDDTRFIRRALYFIAALFFGYIWLDYLRLLKPGQGPGLLFFALAIRAGFFFFIVGIVAGMGRMPTAARRDATVLASVLAGGIAFGLISLFISPADEVSNLSMMLLITLSIYMFLPNRFALMLAAAVVSCIGYVLLMLGTKPTASQTIIAIVQLTLANVVGASVAYRIHRLRRRAYASLRQEQDYSARLAQEIAARNEEIERRKAIEVQLSQLANTDPLTEAANRRHFEKIAGIELDRSRRYGHPLSVLMVDIDHFKKINDQFLHAMGDQVLRRFVAAAREVLRGQDTIGRLGGEEFAVLLPETGLEQARIAAERLRIRVKEIVLDSEHGPIAFTVSAGVSAWNAPEETIDPALARADRALYEAKSAGRDRVKVGV